LGTQIAAILLILLTGLIEAAVPALRSRRQPPATIEESWLARLRRRMGDEPRRTRLAAACLRGTVLALILLAIALAPEPERLAVAVTAACGFALLVLLAGMGWLRRDGATSERAAGLVAWLVAPWFALLRPGDGAKPAAMRDSAEAIADIADALVTEPAERHAMVEALLGLTRRRVEDVMIPRSEIDGIDITSDWNEVMARIRETPHTRMPLFEGELDRVHGIIHMRLIGNELAIRPLTRERLREIAARREALFTPEGTTLYEQLLRFRRLRRRIAFVVDEYGDLQGLVTLEDILEEVVGEFTTEAALPAGRIDARADGSHVVAGAMTLREINRRLGCSLPLDGPRTLSGLIVERMESIPQPGAVITIGDSSIEVLQIAGNAVRTARLLRIAPDSAERS
jgi:Mg2+/Co2+ transporter CorB